MRRALNSLLAALRADLFRIVQVNFGEFLFHALRHFDCPAEVLEATTEWEKTNDIVGLFVEDAWIHVHHQVKNSGPSVDTKLRIPLS